MSEMNFLYPIRECDFEENEGLVIVLYKNKKPSFIWHLCDGNKNVGEIINTTQSHFNEKIEPAEQRVHLFINQLNKNRLIKLYEKK